MKRIIVKDTWKKFDIGIKENSKGALGRIVSAISGKEKKRNFWVLKNISFDAEAGEIIGIIGKNGSGKSTLLRIIAKIYTHDKGEIITNGKIVSLIGMPEGLDLRLSMKDNISLCCSILGLNQKETQKRFDAIVKFAELENFVDTKVYQFSSGMVARLAFSIAIHSIPQKPEILLLDEILAVGDEHYKNKCIERVKELLESGATALIVSHDLSFLKKNCNRIIWIEKGEIKKEGSMDILSEYENYSNQDNNKELTYG